METLQLDWKRLSTELLQLTDLFCNYFQNLILMEIKKLAMCLSEIAQSGVHAFSQSNVAVLINISKPHYQDVMMCRAFIISQLKSIFSISRAPLKVK